MRARKPRIFRPDAWTLSIKPETSAPCTWYCASAGFRLVIFEAVSFPAMP
jgi:hypothetical protein